MADRKFQMRCNCRYEGSDNAPVANRTEILTAEGWTPFELGPQVPGFLMFVYAILNCQHLYMRTNAAERGFVLSSASGTIDVLTAEDWRMKRLHIRFEGQLASGAPSSDDIAYIVERMRHCPASVNLLEPPDTQTELRLAGC